MVRHENELHIFVTAKGAYVNITEELFVQALLVFSLAPQRVKVAIHICIAHCGHLVLDDYDRDEVECQRKRRLIDYFTFPPYV